MFLGRIGGAALS